MTASALQAWAGDFWPYLVVLLVGVLPTDLWRALAVILTTNLREDSELLVWVRLVASALLIAVVAKLLLYPTGTLARIPAWGRLGAMVAGLGALFLLRRSVIAAVVVAEIVLVTAGIVG